MQKAIDEGILVWVFNSELWRGLKRIVTAPARTEEDLEGKQAPLPADLMGCRSNMGGWSSASSMAVMPTAQMSQSWLYPPFFSTAATSGAIL